MNEANGVDGLRGYENILDGRRAATCAVVCQQQELVIFRVRSLRCLLVQLIRAIPGPQAEGRATSIALALFIHHQLNNAKVEGSAAQDHQL